MRVKKNRLAKVRAVGGEIFLIKSEAVFKINQVGEEIWSCLGSTWIDSNDVANKLSEKYEVAVEVLLEDIEDYIANLESENFVEIE